MHLRYLKDTIANCMIQSGKWSNTVESETQWLSQTKEVDELMWVEEKRREKKKEIRKQETNPTPRSTSQYNFQD